MSWTETHQCTTEPDCVHYSCSRCGEDGCRHGKEPPEHRCPADLMIRHPDEEMPEDEELAEYRSMYRTTAQPQFDSWPAERKLAELRRMVAEHSANLLADVLVDVQTAQAVLLVHEALGDERKAELLALPISRMGDVSFRLISRAAINDIMGG